MKATIFVILFSLTLFPLDSEAGFWSWFIGEESREPPLKRTAGGANSERTAGDSPSTVQTPPPPPPPPPPSRLQGLQPSIITPSSIPTKLEAPAIPGKLSTVPKLQMDVTPQSTAPISQKPKSSNSTEGYATPKGVIRATQPMTKKPASRTQR